MSGIVIKNSFILLFVFILNEVHSQGLRFRANNNPIEYRTSYKVFAKKSPIFKNYLKINFNLSINNPNSFGFVLFIEDVENKHYYNLVYSNKNDSLSYLKFSIDSKQILISAPLLKKYLERRKWLNILIKFNIYKDSIEFNVDNRLFTAYVNFSTNKIRPLLFFGKHGSFIDVPDISIRRLQISDNNKSFIFDFKETKGTQVHDSKGIVRGKVVNPIWLINESFYWKLRFKFSSNQVTAINFDPNQQRFILINRDSIYLYKISKDIFTRLRLPKKTPVPLRLGQSFIISEGQEKICVYEVNDVESSKPTVACLNLHTFQWEIWSYDQLNKQSHHHIGVFNSEKGEYLIFGGFGNKEYSNDFYSISKSSKLWKTIHFKGDRISPRFFSGCAKLNKNELLIFGGAGNPTGKQSAGKIYYTDCYRVNFQNRTIKRLWNTYVPTNMVSGANLILSIDSTHFYSIFYPEYIPHTYLKLYKFSIETGKYEVIGDSIPMVSERIRTNANLYFNRILNELYCVTQEFELDGSSKVKIYSISYPPVSRINYYSKPMKRPLFSFIYTLFFLTGCSILFILWRKYYNKKKLEIQKSLILQSNYSIKVQTSRYKNAIYLFGEFKVFDKRGNEISHLFSPKIKQLFLLILLNSGKNKITSKEIYSILWPERPLAKAKNAKGVLLNKLRKIVTDIDGLELRNENKHLYFITRSNFYCDYFDLLIHLNIAKTHDDLPDETLNNLINIVSKGRFLESVDLEYFDRIKKDLENEILLIIPFQLEKYFKEENYIKVIQLCKIIYHIDVINELSFHYELVSYLKLNMLNKAKKRFNAFILEYKKILDTDYKYTFHDLIDHKKSFEFIKQKSI